MTRTKTLPEDKRRTWYAGSDAITALRVAVDSGALPEFELDRDRGSFTIGSGRDCEIAIPGNYISRTHARLERQGDRLVVTDLGSKNGVAFRRVLAPRFEIAAGDTFECGTARFLALNDVMRAAYPTLVDIIGEERDDQRAFAPRPLNLVVEAVAGNHLLILGEPDLDQARLARTIHGISRRRGETIVEIAGVPRDTLERRNLLARAEHSTLVLTIDDDDAALDRFFLDALFSYDYDIRAIVIAPTLARAHRALGSAELRSVAHVPLRPLRSRVSDLPGLLDGALAAVRAPFRAFELAEVNRAALARYPWPGNFGELRLVAERLAQIARHGGLRASADAIGLKRSTLQFWYNQLGLSWPLLRSAG